MSQAYRMHIFTKWIKSNRLWSTMKSLKRGWKQKFCWIAFAGGLVLILNNYHLISKRSFPKGGVQFWKFNGRGVGESSRNIRLASYGERLVFINKANNTALVQSANKAAIPRWHNLTEKPDKKVPDVPFEVCKEARFVKGRSYPLIALASVPGSGNTWVRYLIERASGFYTGSVYRDQKLFDGGFRGELVSPLQRTTLIVKTHDTGSADSTRHFKGAVVIIRNPYDTLLAYANLVKAGHTGWASEQYYKSEAWDAFVESASISWEDRITTWVTRNNVMVVFFEHLKTDLRHQITRVLEFLHAPVNETRLDCMEAHAEGSFHRQKGGNNRTLDPYSEKHKAIIEKHIDAASKVLRQTGHIDYNLTYSGLSKLL